MKSLMGRLASMPAARPDPSSWASFIIRRRIDASSRDIAIDGIGNLLCVR